MASLLRTSLLVYLKVLVGLLSLACPGLYRPLHRFLDVARRRSFQAALAALRVQPEDFSGSISVRAGAQLLPTFLTALCSLLEAFLGAPTSHANPTKQATSRGGFSGNGNGCGVRRETSRRAGSASNNVPGKRNSHDTSEHTKRDVIPYVPASSLFPATESADGILDDSTLDVVREERDSDVIPDGTAFDVLPERDADHVSPDVRAADVIADERVTGPLLEDKMSFNIPATAKTVSGAVRVQKKIYAVITSMREADVITYEGPAEVIPRWNACTIVRESITCDVIPVDTDAISIPYGKPANGKRRFADVMTQEETYNNYPKTKKAGKALFFKKAVDDSPEKGEAEVTSKKSWQLKCKDVPNTPAADTIFGDMAADVTSKQERLDPPTEKENVSKDEKNIPNGEKEGVVGIPHTLRRVLTQPLTTPCGSCSGSTPRVLSPSSRSHGSSSHSPLSGASSPFSSSPSLSPRSAKRREKQKVKSIRDAQFVAMCIANYEKSVGVGEVKADTAIIIAGSTMCEGE